ncbi:MAG TPA: glycosyltransferase family A protein [Pyrinomonadaceae bacterium]|nr:glycosyltransferase family A protein [Pyrinomonadaceae bacterium]
MNNEPNMDHATSVSVIIPVFNGQLYLRAALESVFGQDHKPYEVIVVDDGSTDTTPDIIREFNDVTYLRQSNKGVAVARNRGLDIARGEFIAFLDQDDVWTPNKLAVQVQYFLDHPEIQYTLTHQQFFLEPGASIPTWFRKELLSEPHPGFVPSTLMARRGVFEKIGRFETQYSHASDSDWFFRASQAQLPTAVIPEVLLQRRIHQENESSKAKIALGELRRVVKRSIDLERAKFSN